MQKEIDTIKAIVFDYGGVIRLYTGRNLMEAIAELLNVEELDFRARYYERNHLSNVGNLAFEDLLMLVVQTYTEDEVLIEKIRNYIIQSQADTTLNHELLGVISLMRDRGYKTAILSNAPKSLREKLERLDILKYFDEVVISGEIGFQKPFREAFEVVFKRLNVNPSEVIFIDDTKKSLEKAQEIGYTPIHFKDTPQLVEELSRHGIAL